ncbi:MAG: preprotein translocase subunit SecG [Firmicutes bacterium]|nr:preprotein translocase subunit SecG [Bacillota bacterium]
MDNLLQFLSVAAWITVSFPIIRIVLAVLLVLVCLGLLVTVLMTPSQGYGIGALTGQATDTYYSKHKKQSLEGLIKKLTVIFGICAAVLSILFFVSLIIYPAY